MMTTNERADRYLASKRRTSDAEVLDIMTALAKDVAANAIEALRYKDDFDKIFCVANLMHDKAKKLKSVMIETVRRNNLGDERMLYYMLNQMYASLSLTNAVVLIGKLRKSLAPSHHDTNGLRQCGETVLCFVAKGYHLCHGVVQ